MEVCNCKTGGCRAESNEGRYCALTLFAIPRGYLSENQAEQEFTERTMPCEHANEVCRNGDTYCADCGELL